MVDWLLNLGLIWQVIAVLVIIGVLWAIYDVIFIQRSGKMVTGLWVIALIMFSALALIVYIFSRGKGK